MWREAFSYIKCNNSSPPKWFLHEYTLKVVRPFKYLVNNCIELYNEVLSSQTVGDVVVGQSHITLNEWLATSKTIQMVFFFYIWKKGSNAGVICLKKFRYYLVLGYFGWYLKDYQIRIPRSNKSIRKKRKKHRKEIWKNITLLLLLVKCSHCYHYDQYFLYYCCCCDSLCLSSPSFSFNPTNWGRWPPTYVNSALR